MRLTLVKKSAVSAVSADFCGGLKKRNKREKTKERFTCDELFVKKSAVSADSSGGLKKCNREKASNKRKSKRTNHRGGNEKKV